MGKRFYWIKLERKDFESIEMKVSMASTLIRTTRYGRQENLTTGG